MREVDGVFVREDDELSRLVIHWADPAEKQKELVFNRAGRVPAFIELDGQRYVKPPFRDFDVMEVD